jgi:hypothetical protein
MEPRRTLSCLYVQAGGIRQAQIMLLDRRGGNASQLTKLTGDIGDLRLVAGRQASGAHHDGGRCGHCPSPSSSMPCTSSRMPTAISAPDSGSIVSVRCRGAARRTADHRFALQRRAAILVSRRPARSPLFARANMGPDQDGRADIDVVDAQAGAVPRNVHVPMRPIPRSSAWSPDGKLIAYMQGIEPKFNAYIQDRFAVVPAEGGAAAPADR